MSFFRKNKNKSKLLISDEKTNYSSLVSDVVDGNDENNSDILIPEEQTNNVSHINNIEDENNDYYNFRNELLKCNNETKIFTLEGQYKLCKVVDVYDGNTIKVVFDLNGTFYRWNVKMIGYNVHKMEISINNPARESLKQLAIESRDFLKSIIFNDNQLVYIKCGNLDKYGTLMGTIYLNQTDKVSVNQLMIINHKNI